MAHPTFDDHRPPSKELIEDCVHCGFCLPTCPTYALWGEETDSPRGRIVLMNEGLASGISEEMVTHLDRCLGCMACVTACPSGVRYDRLIETTRAQVERNVKRPLRDRALRRAVFALFAHPGRIRAVAPLLAAYRRLGRPGGRALARFPRLDSMRRLAPDVTLRDAFARVPEFTPAVGERRGRVGLLLGCVQRVFFPGVNRATVEVLAAEGFEVVAPRRPACCGALMVHTGYEAEAAGRARTTIEAFEDCDFVVANAAGCGSSMKEYGEALADDVRWAERARAFAAKVRDVSELLAEIEPVAERAPVALKVAYHDACHLAHAQGVRAEPRRLLEGIPGLVLLEPREQDICCGSAGIYNLLQPRAAEELGARKAENILATGAEAIAAGNPGCTLQIAAQLRERGRELPIFHPVELLAAAIRGGQR